MDLRPIWAPPTELEMWAFWVVLANLIPTAIALVVLVRAAVSTRRPRPANDAMAARSATWTRRWVADLGVLGQGTSAAVVVALCVHDNWRGRSLMTSDIINTLPAEYWIITGDTRMISITFAALPMFGALLWWVVGRFAEAGSRSTPNLALHPTPAGEMMSRRG